MPKAETVKLPAIDTLKVPLLGLVKNGAPVQGRIATPQTAPEVVKRIAGRPVASRRILIPNDKRDDEDETDQANPPEELHRKAPLRREDGGEKAHGFNLGAGLSQGKGN